MTFEVLPLAFEFRALDEIYLPRGKTGNVFRGALGDLLRRVACRSDCPGAKSCPHRETCAYARFFEPRLETGPSGLADPPRPFVLRPHAAEGKPIHSGRTLSLDVHVFDVRTPYLPYLIAALRLLAESGLGPGRGRASLERVCSLDASRRRTTTIYENGRFQIDRAPNALSLPLDGPHPALSRLRLQFLSPTEIKADGHPVERPEFRVLIARLRDRIASLDALYGTASVVFDWKALEEAAVPVRIVRESLRSEQADRRSTRTGQVHPIGGFMGEVEYEGPVGPFLPLIRAGEWAGVGRQTVWGKGAYEVDESLNA